MEFERIRWPEDERDPERGDALELDRYKCSGCGELLNDRQRDQAVRVGSWVDRGTGVELFEILKTAQPKKIAFHQPA